MSSKIYSIEEIQAMIAPIAESFGVERIYLFGSYARGEATENSDLDLRIDKGKIRGYFALGGLFNNLVDALNKPVDLVTTESLDKDFINSISSEEVLIYAN